MSDIAVMVNDGQSANYIAEKYTLSPAYGVAILINSGLYPTYSEESKLPPNTVLKIPDNWIKPGISLPNRTTAMPGLSPMLVLGGALVAIAFLLTPKGKR